MTTQTAVTTIEKAKVNLPTNYAEEMAAEAAAIAKRLGAPGGDFIKPNKDKTFTLPGGEIVPEVTAVVADFVTMNQYYPGKYDANNIQPPACFALGTDLDEMKPSDKSPDKQNDDCKTCWANQFGSDGKGKACKNQRLLGLLPPTDQTEGPLLLIKVSPTGMKHFDQHTIKATGLAGNLVKVVTTITQDPTSEYASLRFAITGANENWEAAWGRRKAVRTRLLTEPEVAAPVEEPKAAGKGGRRK